MVHGIVKSLGGTLTFETEVGRGTSFTILLPICEAEATRRKPEPSGPPPMGHGRILFVDDEPALVQSVTRIMESLGYEVTSFVAAEEALAAFVADPGAFDVVVTDYTMPQMTGTDIISRVREVRPRRSHRPVLGRLRLPSDCPRRGGRGLSHQAIDQDGARRGTAARFESWVGAGRVTRHGVGPAGPCT